MRNVVLIMTASIDGYVVGPKGHAGGMAEEIKVLKDQPGGEIIAWGGASSCRHCPGLASSISTRSWFSRSCTEAASRFSGISVTRST